MSEGSNWCLRRPTGVSGCLLCLRVSMGAYLYLWLREVSEGVYGCLLVYVGAGLLVSEGA